MLSTGQRLTYYGNHHVEVPNPDIKRAVVVIHGLHRTAWTGFGSMITAASLAGVIGETLIVAPHFIEWTDGWMAGGYSVPSIDYDPFSSTLDVGPYISSFAAVDELVLAMTDPARFPNVREVVIAGH